jgi:hypothetical protein
LLEAKSKAKREAKLAKKLVKKSNANGTLAAASERGRQRARELRSIPNG